MALALYRKYRPATFAEVVGQEHVTEPLRVALAAGRVNHAYLFSGPRGCGKTSSAPILARSLNPANPAWEASRKPLDGGLLRVLIGTLPEAERYSYVFEGNSQVLDHLLASQGMKVLDYDVVHLNAEFHDQVSDHDPQILRTRLTPEK